MNSREPDQIRDRYERRMKDASLSSKYGDTYYNREARKERETLFIRELGRKFSSLQNIRLLEIGAGNGSNLGCFHNAGIPWDHIHANEMLDERIDALNELPYPIHVIPGDAMDIDERIRYDVVFQSTVFTSILDQKFRVALADKMKRLLADGGMILWYDFIYNNPSNPDVKGVPLKELKKLFADAKNIRTHAVTLAPPIGRRVGRLYNFFNTFTFLRTHVVAVIEY